MNRRKVRRLLGSLLLITSLSTVGLAGCNVSDDVSPITPKTNNKSGNNEPGNNEPGNNEPGNNEPGNNEPGNNQPGPVERSSIHHLCAAAGTTTDGSVNAVHCLGPHETAGFVASDGDVRWHPGAMHVVGR